MCVAVRVGRWTEQLKAALVSGAERSIVCCVRFISGCRKGVDHNRYKNQSENQGGGVRRGKGEKCDVALA